MKQSKFFFILSFVIILSIPVNANAFTHKRIANWVGEKVKDVVSFIIEVECIVLTELGEVSGINDVLGQQIPSMGKNQRDVLIHYFNVNNKYFCGDLKRAGRVLIDLYVAKQNSESVPLDLMTEFGAENSRQTLVDALRHSRTTAIVTRILADADEDNDQKWGLKFMTAYEVDNYNESYLDRIMDAHNNNVGKQLYVYLNDKGFSTGDTAIEQALMSRCYTYIDSALNESTFSSVAETKPGLIYHKKIGVARENNGVNCPIANIQNSIYYFDFFNINTSIGTLLPSSHKIELSADGSVGNISQYTWTFERPLKSCSLSTCISSSVFTSNDIYFNQPDESVYLLDGQVMKVVLNVENEFGEKSEPASAWINNWSVFIPVWNLLLN